MSFSLKGDALPLPPVPHARPPAAAHLIFHPSTAVLWRQAALAAAVAAVAGERVLSPGDAADVLLPHVLAAVTKNQPDEVCAPSKPSLHARHGGDALYSGTDKTAQRCRQAACCSTAARPPCDGQEWMCGWQSNCSCTDAHRERREPKSAQARAGTSRHDAGQAWRAQLMDAWVRALAALAPQLERAVVKARIVPLALSKAQAHETSVQARRHPDAHARLRM